MCERTYGVTEIANLLGTCRATVLSWCRNGKIVSDKAPGRLGGYSVKESDLKRFLEQHPIYYSENVYVALNVGSRSSNIDFCISELEKSIETLTTELNRLKVIKGMMKGEKKR